MHLVDARARRSAVLRDSFFKSTDVTGSNGGCERALNTTSRPQGGTAGGRGECYPLAPLRKLTTSACLPIDCLPCGEGNEAIAATYTFSVDGRDPLSSMYCRKLRHASDTLQIAGSIWVSPHNFTNTPHFKAYKRLVEGARTSESVSSTRECRAGRSAPLISAAHEGSTTPGSGATPSRPPGIANPSLWWSARAVPPAVLSGLGTKAGSAGSGWWVSLKLAPPWSCITPVAISWSEEKHTAWLLASAISARAVPAKLSRTDACRALCWWAWDVVSGRALHLSWAPQNSGWKSCTPACLLGLVLSLLLRTIRIALVLGSVHFEAMLETAPCHVPLLLCRVTSVRFLE